MRVRELNNILDLLEDLGHNVECKYTGRNRRSYKIDGKWEIEVERGNVKKPRRIEE